LLEKKLLELELEFIVVGLGGLQAEGEKGITIGSVNNEYSTWGYLLLRPEN
jgi:hypothetical protein